MSMIRIFTVPLLITALSVTSALAEETPEATESDKFFKLLEEFAESSEGFFNDLATEFGPSLNALQDTIKDWSQYEAPEVLPNGDIIIRKKQSEEIEKKPLPEGTKEI